MNRHRRQRASGDDGSALAIALTFLMVFGLIIGVVLQFATTGQRTTLTVRDEATSTYAGGGALDGAVNSVRGALSKGTEAAGTSTCFSLPAGELQNPTAVSVTCAPRAGSGSITSLALQSQPRQAILTTSTLSAEGLTEASGADVTTQGDVLVKNRLTVPGGVPEARLTALTAAAGVTGAGSVSVAQASPCTPAGYVNVTPSCGANILDPATDSTAYPSTWDLGATTFPSVVTVPACKTPTVTLSPGTYASRSALVTLLTTCVNTVFHFTRGLYYFDFEDTGTHEAAVSLAAGSVMVGGQELGWTPGITPASSVPFPTPASPTASACDTSKAGVELVFGADSRFNLSGGKVQLCARNVSTSAQHVVVRGLRSSLSLPGTGGSTNPAGAVDGGTSWGTATNRANALMVDGTFATASVAKRTSSSVLTIGPYSDFLVPQTATTTTLTVTATEKLSAAGTMQLRVAYGDGSGFSTWQTLLTCTAACTASPDPTAFAGLTAAQLNKLSIQYQVVNPSGASLTASLDGIELAVAYTGTLRATDQGAATAYSPSDSTTYAVLKASGAYPATTLALHGTVYVPSGAVDLTMTAVPYPAIDRGIVARHLNLGLTPAPGYSGAMIAVPKLPMSPRRMLMMATDGASVPLARADVSFSDGSGGNGSLPVINEWSVN